MNELVLSKNQQVVTNSLLVAEKFEKRHKNVMQAINELITSAEKSANLFVASEYPDLYGRMQPMYFMNRDGFSLLVMGFSGEKALNFKLEFMEAFNNMEKTILNSPAFQVPQSFSEALMLAAKQAKEIEKQQKQLEEQASKVEIYEECISAIGNHSLNYAAKIIGIGRNNMIDALIGLHILDRNNVPYQTYINRGYFEVKMRIYYNYINQKCTIPTTLVTPKGIEYLRKRLQEMQEKQCA